MNEREIIKKAFLKDDQDLFFDNENDIKISKELERRAEKLIRKQRRPFYGFLSTAAGKAACAAVLIIAVFGAAMCFPAVRNGVYGFFTAGNEKGTTASEAITLNIDPAEWKYELCEDDTLGIIEYEGEDERVTIPETIDGKAVTTIKKARLADTVKEITIPETVEIIEKGAFEGCEYLISVTIPKSVTTIEENAFAGCDNIKNVYYSGTKSGWENIFIEKNNDALFSGVVKCLATDAIHVVRGSTATGTLTAYGTIDSKEEAYHRCLNTIDYFDSASGHFISILNGEKYDVEYSSDMINRLGYEHFKDDKGNDLETFVFDSKRIRYDNVNSLRTEFPYDMIKKEDAKNAGDDREKDGTFNLRADPTMISQSCAALYPQVMAHGLLGDLSGWDIAGNTEYAGRDCVMIKGKIKKESYKNIKTFTLYIDAQTGVWLYCKGTDASGNTVYSLESAYFSTDCMSKEEFRNTYDEKEKLEMFPQTAIKR